ncbi:MAG: hypothetical protein O9275_05145 [Microcystis sp. LE19-196.1B]|nr:hypothetical protein [Microcystis sp. LE19-196.1B]
MRLRDIKQKIVDNKNLLNLEDLGRVGENLVIRGMSNTKQALLNIKGIPGLTKRVEEILAANIILQAHADQVHIEYHLAQSLIILVNNLKNESQIILNLINELLPEKQSLTFSIKLQPLEKFSDFSETIHTFEKVILRPISLLGEDVIIGELDHGSRWMDIMFNSLISYYCFAGIVEKSFDIYIDKYQKKKALEIVLNTFNHSAETINSLKRSEEENFKQICSIATDSLIKELQNNEILSPKSKEINDLCIKSRNDLQFAIEKQEELIEKGLEIYQTLEKGDQEHRKIPDFSQKETLITSQKKITNEN